jgi:subtilisin family serine protease
VSRFSIQPLEDRRLLAWGTYPQLIQQDDAVANYPSITGAGVNIAVIDSGVDFNHANLAGKFWTNPGEIAGNGVDDDGDGYKDDTRGWDFYNNDNNPEDQNGHGTAISGILAASQFTFNGATYQGIAPGAKLIPLKISDPTGAYSFAFAQRVEKALQWVEANTDRYNIKIVSMSIRTPQADYAATYQDEVARLAAKGVFMVAAGGQEDPNLDVEYPARDANVFGVSVLNSNGTFPTNTVNRGPGIDLLAPGNGVPILQKGGGFTTSALATSYATPFAAGAAALLRQVNSGYSISQLTSLLKNNGVNVTDTSTGFTFSGLTYKRLDLFNTLKAAIPPVGTTPGANGSTNGIAYDDSGNLHMAWYDENTHNLKYAKRSAAGTWGGTTTVDAGQAAGQYVSVAVNSADQPGIAYFDAFNADLKFAQFNGSSWVVSTVDSNKTVGYYPSLQFNGSDRAVISYFYKTGGDLRLATQGASGWTIQGIDSTGDVGRSSSLALNPLSGRWSVAYEDTTHGTFKYADQTKSSWAPVTFDGSTKGGGGYISLAFNTSKRPVISYYDAYNADLKFATFSGSRWSTQVVAGKGTVGLYSNMYTGSDGTDILYFNKGGNQLWRATQSGSTWSLSQLASGGGRWISRSIAPDLTETIAYLGASGINILDL